MLAGSLGVEDKQNNEFQALMEGMKSYFEDWDNFILETDHVDAFWELRNSTFEGAIPEHAELVQQLNQCSGDLNFVVDVKTCDKNCNELKIFLVEHGAGNYDQMVVNEEPFGRIPHIWSMDMGLGSAKNKKYMLI
ncbi:hypothetical protein POM88_008594 [Heracleum sosnowskyi]|uniref:Uncharacterized protein n=1 Tax=Heracleum sosnowskyi TaxID=360622 RepID=A0AAD8N7I1_9APIA|nr:hypothetical protein POM88_008594 [Heracleum sosnowskyi]